MTQRLAALVREALIPPKPRKKTKPTRAPAKNGAWRTSARNRRTKKDRGRKFDGGD